MRASTTYRLLAAAAIAGVVGCSFKDSVSYQVLPAQQFTATLSPDNETPPTTSAATGSAVFGVINDTILSWRVDVGGADSITASHIHAGAAGVAGPIIVNLFAAPGAGCRQNTDTLLAIATSSIGNPTVITTTAAHKLAATGATALVRMNHPSSTPPITGDYTATVTGATTFTVPVNVTAAGVGGTAQRISYINITSPRCRVGYSGALAQAQIRPANLTVGAIQ